MSRGIFICILLLFAGMVHIVLGYCRGDFIPEKLCATLFSKANFEGDSFHLKNFDQSANLKRDYRPSLTGWLGTGSVKVEAGCKLALCDDAYFTGNCHLLTSELEDNSNIISGVRSANCSCSRECKCEDVHIGKDEYARAYLKKDCSTCDADYLSLVDVSNNIPTTERNAVTAFAIRSGCNLTIYSGEGQRGDATYFASSFFQGFRGTASSYRVSCDDAKFTSHSPPRDKVLPFSTMVLPESIEELYGLLADNYTLSNHPGLQAALTSAESGRSARNAYVILFGTLYPYEYGFPQCDEVATDKIGVCNIPVDMDHVGLSKTQLTIIVVPIGYSGASVEHDYRLMATLDEFLSAHKDLNQTIPNAVILRQYVAESGFTSTGSEFQRRLQALHSIRHRLVNENYSNVVFLLNTINNLPASEQRNPETKIADFTNEITQKWTFPSPATIVLQSVQRVARKHVNGFRRMENSEYWPRNLETSLENLCEKAGDPLGHAILKAYFQIKDIPTRSVKPKLLNMLNSSHNKVLWYQDIATSAVSQKKVWRTLHSSMSLEAEDTKCGDVIPEKRCATLFSAGNFEGHSFNLVNFDQSVHLRKDYRASPSGWPNTGSVKIEAGCKLSLCNDTNLLGTCQSINSDVASLSQHFSWSRSANCGCSAEDCRCEDVFIEKDEFGRAYLKGGCSTCHAKYIRLLEASNFPTAAKDSVEAFVLRRGCTLTIYTEAFLTGTSTVITGPILQDFRQSVGSYKFSCDNAQFKPQPISQQTSGEPMLELPVTNEEMFDLISTKEGNFSNHLGLRAALKSGENGRSPKIAFIVVIGTYRPRYSGFPQCPDGLELQISECCISLNLADLGIGNTELRVITLPIGADRTSKIEDDYRLMASLDSYLSSNENLQNSIPNVVVVYHRVPFKYFATSDSSFQRKLQALHALRGRVLDETYSNVVYLLDNIEWLPDSKERFQDAAIDQFEKIISQEWAFPSPTVIIPRADAKFNSHYVNGYRRLGNQQYWPRNLQVSLVNTCANGGDPLGQAILKTVFQCHEISPEILKFTNIDLIPANDSKVGEYLDYAARALSQQPQWRRLHATLSSESKLTMEVGDYVPEKVCATIYSIADFQGEPFVLGGYDRIVNLKKDRRFSSNGWKSIGSVKVESGCQIILCNGTYFSGSCHNLTSDAADLDQLMTITHSAICSCDRECTCEEIFIPKHEYGRAYLNGGCDSCNTEYLKLWKSGCNLTYYSGSDFRGDETVITDPVVKQISGKVGSYKVSCADSQFVPSPLPENTNSSVIDLPTNRDALYMARFSDNIMSDHPGLDAALKSYENGKSFKNGYVVLLGTSWPILSRFPQCKEAPWNKIGECRIPINLGKLGIREVELKIVTVPIACCPGSSKEGDYRLMASLDEYLSRNDDLRSSVPNAVIVYHRIPNNGNVRTGYSFQQKLEAIHALRGRLLNEDYSNVVYLLDNFQMMPNLQADEIEKRISQFENEIEQNWAFPSPVVVVPRTDANAYSHYVNGYRKLWNGEIWPMNLEMSLLNICEKGEDPLGKAVLKEFFGNNELLPESCSPSTFDLIPANSTKVIQYQDMASSAQSHQPLWRNFRSAFPRVNNRKVETQVQQLKADTSKEKKWMQEYTEKTNRILSELHTKYLNLEVKTTKLETENKMLRAELEKINTILVDLAEETRKEIWEKLKEDLSKLFH